MQINNVQIRLKEIIIIGLVAASIVAYFWKGDQDAAMGFGIAAFCVYAWMD